MLRWVKKTFPKNYLGPQSPFKTTYNTVDGQNPAPPRMMTIPLFIRFLTIPGGCLGFLPSTVLLVLPLFIFVITLLCFCWLQLLRSTNHNPHRSFVYKKPPKPRPTLPYYPYVRANHYLGNLVYWMPHDGPKTWLPLSPVPRISSIHLDACGAVGV